MNMGELPFIDMVGTDIVMGVELGSHILCLNSAAWFEDEETLRMIELSTEVAITHETIHALLNEFIGLRRSPWWDMLDYEEKISCI